MTWPRVLAVAVATGVLTTAFPWLAAADPSDSSTVTVTVAGGSLEIDVQAAQTSLGTVTSSESGTTVRGKLGQVVVSDRRNAASGAGWVASVVATDFRPRKGSGIPGSRVRYIAGPIEKDGSATYTANDPKNLNRAKAVVTATDITGNNTATWTPTIEVSIPAGLVAGDYTATITHSVV